MFKILLFLLNIHQIRCQIVNTSLGAIQGERISTEIDYFSFKGIPYAAAPVGKLRFQPPQPHKGWKGVLDATKHGPRCLQIIPRTIKLDFDEPQGEDCLFLNVYTPSLQGKRAVMVFIHGGGFSLGWGDSDFYGPEYLLAHDVLLVTLNYRLGPFGFLASGDAAAPGNYGMKDMVQGLVWVKENIAAFGGDPKAVTIFGESAGSAAVHYLTLSPMAKGLFVRAISESGTALNPWAFQPNSSLSLRQVARRFDLEAKSSAEIVEILRSVDSRELLLKTADLIYQDAPRGTQPFIFAPVVEPNDFKGPKFLPKSPINLIKDGQMSKVPCIFGANSHESLFMVAEWMIDPMNLAKLNANPNLLVPYYWNIPPSTSEAQKAIQAFRNLYFNNGPIRDHYSYSTFMTDSQFMFPIQRAVQLTAKQQQEPVYFYIFSYSGHLNYLKRFLQLSKYSGAVHTDELPYLFRMSMLPKVELNKDDPDLKVIEIMTKMWTNFAKTGNPISEDMGFEWPAVQDSLEYLNITLSPEPSSWPFEHRMTVWRKLNEEFTT